MPVHKCPRCNALAPRMLEAASKDAYVTYYHCPECLHTFTVSKDGKETIRHVTPVDDFPESKKRP